MEKIKSVLTTDQEKSAEYMMYLAERTALYLDYEDEKAVGYSVALDEVVESLTKQGLNPLAIALDRLQK